LITSFPIGKKKLCTISIVKGEKGKKRKRDAKSVTDAWTAVYSEGRIPRHTIFL